MYANDSRCSSSSPALRSGFKFGTFMALDANIRDGDVPVRALPPISPADGGSTNASRLLSEARRMMGVADVPVGPNKVEYKLAKPECSPYVASASAVKYQTDADAKRMMPPESVLIFEKAEIVGDERIFYVPPTHSTQTARPVGEIESCRWFSSNVAHTIAMDNGTKYRSKLVVKTEIDAGPIVPLTESVVVQVIASTDQANSIEGIAPTHSMAAASASALEVPFPMIVHVNEVRREVGNLMKAEGDLMFALRGTFTMFNKSCERDRKRIGRAGPKIAEALEDAGLNLEYDTVLDLCSAPGSSLSELGGKHPTAVVYTHNPLLDAVELPMGSRVITTDLEHPCAVERVVVALTDPESKPHEESLGAVQIPGGTYEATLKITGDGWARAPFSLVIGDGAVSQVGATNRTAAEWEIANMRLILSQWAVALSCVRAGGSIIIKMFGPQTQIAHWLIMRLSRCGAMRLVKPTSSRAANEEFYVVLMGCLNTQSLAKDLRSLLSQCSGQLPRMWTVPDDVMTSSGNDAPAVAIKAFLNMCLSRQCIVLDAFKIVAVTHGDSGRSTEQSVRRLAAILSMVHKNNIIATVMNDCKMSGKVVRPTGTLPEKLVPRVSDYVDAALKIPRNPSHKSSVPVVSDIEDWSAQVVQRSKDVSKSVWEHMTPNEKSKLMNRAYTSIRGAYPQYYPAGRLGKEIGYNKPMAMLVCRHLAEKRLIVKNDAAGWKCVDPTAEAKINMVESETLLPTDGANAAE